MNVFFLLLCVRVCVRACKQGIMQNGSISSFHTLPPCSGSGLMAFDRMEWVETRGREGEHISFLCSVSFVDPDVALRLSGNCYAQPAAAFHLKALQDSRRAQWRLREPAPRALTCPFSRSLRTFSFCHFSPAATVIHKWKYMSTSVTGHRSQMNWSK